MNTSTSGLAVGTALRSLAAGVTPAPAPSRPAESADSLAQADPPVVVVVRVPKPWYAPRGIVVGKMRDAVPDYAKRPGLIFKAFSFERDSGDFGGLYFWRDRAGAEAWFNRQWFERVREARGVEAHVRFFEAPVSIDNTAGGTPPDRHSSTVATLVQIPIPAGVDRDRLVAEFKAAVSVYQKVPGLLRKHFTVSPDGRFGGVYLWQDEAGARAWFGEAWHARVVKTYGQDATIEWFDTPILLRTQDAATLADAQTLVVGVP